MKSWALLFGSLAIGLMLVEGALRILGFNQSYYFTDRCGFFSEGAIFQLALGVLARPSHTRVQSAAVYDMGTTELAYNYSYWTNNLGFPHAGDVECGRPTLSVYGDSFFKGQGAAPWFPQVEVARAPGAVQIANLGFYGTGLLNWQAMHVHYSGCL